MRGDPPLRPAYALVPSRTTLLPSTNSSAVFVHVYLGSICTLHIRPRLSKAPTQLLSKTAGFSASLSIPPPHLFSFQRTSLLTLSSNSQKHEGLSLGHLEIFRNKQHRRAVQRLSLLPCPGLASEPQETCCTFSLLGWRACAPSGSSSLPLEIRWQQSGSKTAGLRGLKLARQRTLRPGNTASASLRVSIASRSAALSKLQTIQWFVALLQWKMFIFKLIPPSPRGSTLRHLRM